MGGGPKGLGCPDASPLAQANNPRATRKVAIDLRIVIGPVSEFRIA